jgi:pimeloyl-ACP methyl ester carboxylesterase
VKRLPRAITRVDPESLDFVAEDRYPTASAIALAARHGLAMPDFDVTLGRWIDHLVDTAFLSRPARGGRMRGIAGSRTFVARGSGSGGGSARGSGSARPRIAMLHGLPWDAESWAPVARRTREPTLRVDLPGLGRSSAGESALDRWLEVLIEREMSEEPAILIAHSFAAAPVIELAARRAERVRGIVLVSPFFLQARPPAMLRSPVIACLALGALSARRLERGALRDVPTGESRDAVSHAIESLRRRGVARAAGGHLARAASLEVRARLAAQLERLEVPVLLVVGEHDPLVARPARAEVAIVTGAGHAPHLDAPDTTAKEIARFVAGLDRAVERAGRVLASPSP